MTTVKLTGAVLPPDRECVAVSFTDAENVELARLRGGTVAAPDAVDVAGDVPDGAVFATLYLTGGAATQTVYRVPLAEQKPKAKKHKKDDAE